MYEQRAEHGQPTLNATQKRRDLCVHGGKGEEVIGYVRKQAHERGSFPSCVASGRLREGHHHDCLQLFWSLYVHHKVIGRTFKEMLYMTIGG